MIFIDNKYTYWYYAIISNAQQQTRKKLKKTQSGYIYYERHHIIPKSLGGDNSKENLILLTAREHFICHWLLSKMLLSQLKIKMVNALYMMQAKSANQVRYQNKITSRVYENIKKEVATAQSERRKGRPGFTKGTALSAEHRAKLSAALTGITRKPSIAKGKTHSELYGSEKAAEIKIKRSDSRKGKSLLANIGNTFGAKNKGIPQKLIQCPHCNQEGGNVLRRYHFDNCKEKQ